jgi:hypothetical protein
MLLAKIVLQNYNHLFTKKTRYPCCTGPLEGAYVRTRYKSFEGGSEKHIAAHQIIAEVMRAFEEKGIRPC